METHRQLIKEAVDKLLHYGPTPPVFISRDPSGVTDPRELAELLQEAVIKVDNCAARQRKARLGPRETGAHGLTYQTWINPNPHAGQHYPAVQSFLDRARRVLSLAAVA